MAGRPKLREFSRKMDEDIGGIEWVCDQLIAGTTLAQVIRDLETSEGMFYAWLKTDDCYWPAIREARKCLSHTLVDEAKEIVDGAKAKDASIVRERVRFRTWLAEKYNREDYGPPDKSPQVQVNIGELHLNAMKKHREIEEAEVVEVLPAEPKKVLQDPEHKKSGQPSEED